jgi:hypothetical protein
VTLLVANVCLLFPYLVLGAIHPFVDSTPFYAALSINCCRADFVGVGTILAVIFAMGALGGGLGLLGVGLLLTYGGTAAERS